MNARITQTIATVLSALAGFVDAHGYLALGGLFVAFMSGNSTVLGMGLSRGTSERTGVMVSLVGTFVLGVMAGTWVGHPFGARRAPILLVLMGALLAAAAALGQSGHVVPCCLLVALAMGMENTVFQKHGATGIGLTYMTGTLVRLGQRTAEAVAGGAWSVIVPDLLLWLGMVLGAGLGTAAYLRVGLAGLWVAAAVSALLAAGAWWSQRSSAAIVVPKA